MHADREGGLLCDARRSLRQTENCGDMVISGVSLPRWLPCFFTPQPAPAPPEPSLMFQPPRHCHCHHHPLISPVIRILLSSASFIIIHLHHHHHQLFYLRHAGCGPLINPLRRRERELSRHRKLSI
jgi:hypothetical protein